MTRLAPHNLPAADPSAPLRGAEVGETIREHAARTPGRPAFLHKRHGRWLSFSWAYVRQEVARLEAVLRAQTATRAGSDIRLAVSGAYDPDLVILALAALAAGGRVHAVDPALAGEDLARILAVVAPTQAFVQGRRAIGAWLDVRPGASRPLPLFVARPFVAGNETWTIVPLRDPADDLAAATPRRPERPEGVVWVDEGTQWQGGLGSLLDVLLDEGRTVAFPETVASALRDRRELQPTALLLSAARRARLGEEDRARRGAEGSTLRRLTDWAERSSGLLAHAVNRRRLAVLGLGGLDIPHTHAAPNAAVGRAADATA
ncbi:AMP-binding protein [Ancylobacter lacus]|nr:AMP-binding protein [Ancylobacter lacus]